MKILPTRRRITSRGFVGRARKYAHLTIMEAPPTAELQQLQQHAELQQLQQQHADVQQQQKKQKTAAELPQQQQKLCPTEDDDEVTTESDWSQILDDQPPPTALRPHDLGSHYANGRLIIAERLFSDGECWRINAAAEAIGYGRTNYQPEYRGNLRLITTDLGLAERLWERIRPLVPEIISVRAMGRTDKWRATGLNECFRLAKYYPGHRFGAHCDANFQRSADEKSYYTVNVYTNDVDDADGGKTRFYAPPQNRAKPMRDFKEGENVDLAVRPESGLAVIFQQPPAAELLHDGERLRGGVKYLLRTDVMYERVKG